MMQAIALYRQQFRASPQLAKPYVMLGFNVFAADNDDEAALRATSTQQAFVNLRSGRPSRLPPPRADYLSTLGPPQHALARTGAGVLGDRRTRHGARSSIAAFVERTGADELMITSQHLRPRGAPAFVRDRRADDDRRLALTSGLGRRAGARAAGRPRP